ncbi:cytochrome d ubiquinol oxidase subunit II [Vibrio alginolyticus]|jgi:cytochrome d ubiquinol oxidase subunit II|uniref:Cytochrome d ubiquinol oxidase subunit II n=6 Tax=Vibrio TaxID=662 RepID=A0A2L2K315_9VIBR|nr:MULTISPECIES: cytochrome d ubiquinol oxidase subunit II [Vibrio]MDW1807923.1 cytochrome d ubiquinol oxidase subunit II [Vibrio sp. Vb2362]MDW1970551.1 cytochrome d ubiquinol oxidase subunit II [Vibrio sp. 945]MDW2296957.1 cytochrome d ubiquinol oxidase subunit II [Vibrio sp. 1404]MEA3480855.1 cytochrome d ubiquinol oxidase subunit II [Pseudomonadota bacterium]NAW53160.1 cytochrome d ubiquinol oxidase subunit II [Vibrio sp. V41_P2S12T139]NAW94691.1 cytochrome d ubiquinol oxidase subunit II 
MFDYEILRLIWWVLIGVLLVGFAVTDGFDMGVGALVPIIGKNDTQRRVMINSIAPHWDGNQVWLITAGGALFAAWPLVYATSFSGFYLAMILTLAALWLRPLGLDYRSKIEDPKWRNTWDICISISGFVPPIIFGVAFGNLLQGVPFQLSEFLMPTYHGSFFGLLNPFALLCGLVSLFMILMQGSTWLQMKTTGEVHVRARNVAQLAGLLTVAAFVAAGFWIQNIDGYVIVGGIDTNAASNPLNKEVIREAGAWMKNFENYPLLWAAPVLGVAMPLLAVLASRLEKCAISFITSSLGVAGVIFTAGFAMFPFIMPSDLMPSHSLTMWDATSSELTLNLMTGVAFVMVPIILGYTSWTYYKMFGRLDDQYIEDNKNSLY